MKRIIITTITLGATALLAAGCGGSGEPAKAEAGQGMTATELATSMQRDGFADGSEFADASCVKSGKRTFKCLGDLKATDVSMGKAYGTDYSDLTPNEKQQWPRPRAARSPTRSRWAPTATGSRSRPPDAPARHPQARLAADHLHPHRRPG